MRIGIDVRPLAEKGKSGVIEYIQNLLVHIFLHDRENEYILFYNTHNKKNPPFLENLTAYPNVFLRRFYYPNKILNFFIWYFEWPKIDKLLDVEVLFSPNIIFTAARAKTRHILTVHDMSFLRHPEFFNAYRRFWHWLVNPRRLMSKAYRIVTVSDTSKDDIISLCGSYGGKLFRVYPGLSGDFYPIDRNSQSYREFQKRRGLPSRYILTLATLEPRKNIKSVIMAFEILKKKKKIEHKLLIAGSKGWMFEQTRKIIAQSKFREDIILIGEVADSERKLLYSGADLFVFPSFYEGFGFPPLEALKCGTTVVCSYAASLSEITGNAVLLINPYDCNELAWAMERGIKDQKLKTMLRADGLHWVEKFSWETCAKNIINILTVK